MTLILDYEYSSSSSVLSLLKNKRQEIDTNYHTVGLYTVLSTILSGENSVEYTVRKVN